MSAAVDWSSSSYHLPEIPRGRASANESRPSTKKRPSAGSECVRTVEPSDNHIGIDDDLTGHRRARRNRRRRCRRAIRFLLLFPTRPSRVWSAPTASRRLRRRKRAHARPAAVRRGLARGRPARDEDDSAERSRSKPAVSTKRLPSLQSAMRTAASSTFCGHSLAPLRTCYHTPPLRTLNHQSFRVLPPPCTTLRTHRRSRRESST